MVEKYYSKGAYEEYARPDNLSKCMKMSSPGVVLVSLACLFFVVGIIIWGSFGVVSSHLDAVGTVKQDKIICLLSDDEISAVSVGNDASNDNLSLSVENISEMPLSKAEASNLVGSDYLLSLMMKSDWAYVVTLDVKEGDRSQYNGKPVHLRITTEQLNPIDMILGKRG